MASSHKLRHLAPKSGCIEAARRSAAAPTPVLMSEEFRGHDAKEFQSSGSQSSRVPVPGKDHWSGARNSL
jgi:hypothetical protein